MNRWLSRKKLRSDMAFLCAALVLLTGLQWIAPSVQAVATGDGMMVYGEGTVVTPRYRTLSGSTWSAESSLPTAGAASRYTIIRAAPTRDELIAGVVNASGLLTIYRWNGTTWSSEWTVTTGLGNIPRFDIAYQQSSGKAVVVYSRNIGTTNELAYRVYDGSSWPTATNLDTVRTSGIVTYVRLTARPASNELALAWGDANFDLSANYYDGTNNLWKGEPGAAFETNLTRVGVVATPSSRNFDIAFEQSSGELLVAWGNDADADLHYATRAAGVNGAWGAATVNTSFTKQPLDIQLAPEPGTNYIAYSTISGWDGTTATNFGEAAMWTGTAWANINSYDTSVATVAISIVSTSIEWVQNGGQSRAVLVYDDSAGSGIDWLFFNKNTTTWSAVQTDYTGAPAPTTTGAAGEMYLLRNPYNVAELTYITVDGSSDLFTKKLVFDGTNLTWSSTEPGGASPEATISTKVGWAAGFAYNAYPPGTLGVDVVDAGGTTVGSPSLTLSSIAASDQCQTSTGTLGVSAQKIRATNTTTTQAWSLSIAATAGATGNWSSGAATYDFNDASGSPAGCGDGADADSIAGQLSVNPSAGTITPQAACSATGVTKGSSSAFSQAVTDNITLLSASASTGTNCYWDFTDVSLSQKIPLLQAAGTYSLPMTITIVAN